jgi:hypothetical protein
MPLPAVLPTIKKQKPFAIYVAVIPFLKMVICGALKPQLLFLQLLGSSETNQVPG